METLFIIRNQNNQFLTRKNEWADVSETQTFFKTPHYDIALNQLIEINTKSIDLRCELVECSATDKGLPIVPELDAFTDSAPSYPIFQRETDEASSTDDNAQHPQEDESPSVESQPTNNLPHTANADAEDNAEQFSDNSIFSGGQHLNNENYDTI